MARILVVDDDPGLRNVLRTVLIRCGHQVEVAESGSDALQKATRDSYDAAVVDYHMPPPNGLELLTRLREIQPRCVRLLMSGTLDLPVVMDAINNGEVTRVIQKPFQRQVIVNALDEAIAARGRLEELYIGARHEAFDAQRRQLEECLSADALSLALQPIVGAGDLIVRGYEALLRSTHPALDTAMRVVAAAEVHDMLDRLADRVVDCALHALQTLPTEVNLFINVHPGELADVDKVRNRFERLAPWAHRIILEFTERSQVLQILNWRAAAEYLTGAGFRLAVDDLGSGYNSLSVLAELQPSFAKVDMSIVRNIDRDERKQRIVEMLSRFAKATNIQLIVEGIETEAEAAVIHRLGADLMQGYLFGRPTTSKPDQGPLQSQAVTIRSPRHTRIP
ncbi:MAG TPA: EAL domain-containing response regulator [Steroidobacteraceae bacterium]|nr:EAL domain-containing response regulator [Steroidobacteraceae bacterium]